MHAVENTIRILFLWDAVKFGVAPYILRYDGGTLPSVSAFHMPIQDLKFWLLHKNITAKRCQWMYELELLIHYFLSFSLTASEGIQTNGVQQMMVSFEFLQSRWFWFKISRII